MKKIHSISEILNFRYNIAPKTFPHTNPGIEKFLHMSRLFAQPNEHEQLVNAINLMIESYGEDFFNIIQARTSAFIDDVDANLSPADFQKREHVLTLDNLFLIARYYAGLIKREKRKRDTKDTEHDKVTKLLINKESRIILNTILLNLFQKKL